MTDNSFIKKTCNIFLYTIVDKLNHKNSENNICSSVKQGLTCAIIGNINTIKAKDNIRRSKASRFRSSWLNPSYTNTLLVRFHFHCLAEIRIFHFLPFYTKYRETCKIKLAKHIQLDPEEHGCKRTIHYSKMYNLKNYENGHNNLLTWKRKKDQSM
jgi:hypothetical protein